MTTDTAAVGKTGRVGATLFVLFLADAIAHLALRGLDINGPAWITKALAMPLLLAALVASGVRTRTTRWLAVGLALSWVGDSLPFFFSGDTAFLTMVGGFLLAQFAYIIAFAPRWRRSVFGRRRGWLAIYLLVLTAFLAACLPGAGSLGVAVVVYGTVLMVSAALATGINATTAVGGIIFIASDGMIALGAFADFWQPAAPVQNIAVMSTYFLAQVLLVIGVLTAERAGRVSYDR